MRSILAPSLVLALMAASGPALAEGEPSVDTTHSTAPQTRASCETEATRRSLAGAARTGFLTDCTRPAAAGSAAAPTANAAQPQDKRRVRPSRQECRAQASRIRHLWGLAKHKYIKRCRAGRIPLVGNPAR